MAADDQEGGTFWSEETYDYDPKNLRYCLVLYMPSIQGLTLKVKNVYSFRKAELPCSILEFLTE